MSRKKGLRDLDVFTMTDQAPETSVTSIDAELFGAIQSIDANRQSASPINIFEINPDPRQPRRAIPHIVRESWSGDVREIEQVFTRWVELVEQERGNQAFDIVAFLNAESDVERPDVMGALEETLLSLIELAVSIRSEGLTNPITVAPLGLKYQLETGERRWLAYHLLYLHTRDEKYAKIPARTVDRVNLWRQAAENNARSNLNAISKARQFAVLLMDLLEQKRGSTFTTIDRFEREQQYYSQVADGELYMIPRNTSERLLAAMGLKHSKQLRDYRALLDLPAIVWQIADDLNWAEYAIRALREQAGKSNAMLISLAVKKAREAGYAVPIGTLSEIQPFSKREKEPSGSEILEDELSTEDIKLTPGTKPYYVFLTRTFSKVGPGRTKANREALEVVQDFRRWLDEQERMLRQYLNT
jgi:hypothetical protein